MDRLQSPAYAALTPCARKVLSVIEGKIAEDGGVATISLIALGELCRVAQSTALIVQRQITLLGFVSITPGPRRRSTYRLADGWLRHDAVEAMRLRKQACQQPVRRVPKPFTPRRVERRQPSLPVIRWPDMRR